MAETTQDLGGSGMPPPKNQIAPNPLLLAFAPIDRRALGAACGSILGSLLSIATLILAAQRYDPPFGLGLLSQFFWGYSVSWQGVFIGFLWGMGVGFIFGWSLAVFRNAAVWIWLTVIRSVAEMDEYSDFLDHL